MQRSAVDIDPSDSHGRFMGRLSDSQVIDLLSRSEIYRDYERAFEKATRLPLSLNPRENWHLAQRKGRNENPFCGLMAAANRSCAACLEAQEALYKDTGQSNTLVCFAGLCETSIPLRADGRLVGFLQTGQVMFQKPTKVRFDRTARTLLDWGLKSDLKATEEAWFQTRVLEKDQYESMVRLLTIFAEHLSLVANQILTREARVEPSAVTRARTYIAAHQEEELSLPTVARAVNMSSYYFCKTFKKATGLTFIDYLARLRIEKAKNLLLDPNARVSEVAFEIGFSSITNFNRKFKELVGQSPSAYRETLPRVA